MSITNYILFALGAVSLNLFASELHVRDFGALPDDGKDDRPGILAAFEAAKEQKASILRFDAGVYDIKSFDGKVGSSNRKWLAAKGLNDLAIEGAIDANGKPTTRLIRHHEGQNLDPLGEFLHLLEAKNVTVRNFFMAHDPCFFSQGTIVEKDNNSESFAKPPPTGGSRTQQALESTALGRFPENTP